MYPLGLSETAVKLLRLLQHDAKQKLNALLAELDITDWQYRHTVVELRRKGAIKRFVALPNRKRLGFGNVGFFKVTPRSKPASTQLAELQAMPGTMEIHLLASGGKFLVKVCGHSRSAFDDPLHDWQRKVDALSWVESTNHEYTIADTLFETTAVPI